MLPIDRIFSLINDIDEQSEEIQSRLSEIDDKDISVHTRTNVSSIRPDGNKKGAGKYESRRNMKRFNRLFDEQDDDAGKDDPHVQVMRRENAVEIVVQYDHGEVQLEETETGVKISADDYSETVEIDDEITATERINNNGVTIFSLDLN